MTGVNELILNEATMIEAIQFWLDSKMHQPVPTVTSVKSEKNTYSSEFRVALDSTVDRADCLECGGV